MTALKFNNNDIQRLFLSALSGSLLTLAFPKTDFFLIAYIALIPLFFALSGASARKATLYGSVFGLFHFFPLLIWILHTLKVYGFLPIWLSLPALFLLSFYLSLYTALFSFLLVRFARTPKIFFLTVPFLWTALEFIRANILTGFPWELLGYSQYKAISFIQIADITGVYGVSFFIVFINAALFSLMLFLSGKSWQGLVPAAGQTIIFSCSAVLMVIIVFIYGFFRSGHITALASQAGSAGFSVIQGNIDQSLKWKKPYQVSTIEKYSRLSLQASAEDTDLIIWPETAAPFYYVYNKILTETVQEGIRKTDTPHLIGSPSFKHIDGHFFFYNSAFLTTPEGIPTDKYDKVHLVPFGEYVPLQHLLPFISKLTEQSGNFYPGEKGKALTCGEIRPGVQICFEIVFPELSRAVSANGANVLVNMTNDAWFGKKSAPYQHFSMAVFRAVENRRAIARAANTGISGFIDPTGQILKTTDLFTEAHLTEKLPLMKVKTAYTLFGDFFAWISIFVPVLIFFAGRDRKKLRPAE